MAANMNRQMLSGQDIHLSTEGLRILIIDGNPRWRHFVLTILQDICGDGNVDAVSSFRMGLQQIMPNHDYDLVILGLAEVTPETLKQVSNIRSQQVSVLVYSSALTTSELTRIYRAGATAVDNRPYDRNAIIKSIHRIMDQIRRNQQRRTDPLGILL